MPENENNAPPQVFVMLNRNGKIAGVDYSAAKAERARAAKEAVGDSRAPYRVVIYVPQDVKE